MIPSCRLYVSGNISISPRFSNMLVIQCSPLLSVYLCAIREMSPPSFILYLLEFSYFYSDFSICAAKANSVIFLVRVANGVSVFAFKKIRS